MRERSIIHIELALPGIPLCNAKRTKRLMTMPIPNWKALRSQQHFQQTRTHNPRLCYNCVNVFASNTPLDAPGR
jgi:hypothetical protein